MSDPLHLCFKHCATALESADTVLHFYFMVFYTIRALNTAPHTALESADAVLHFYFMVFCTRIHYHIMCYDRMLYPKLYLH